MRSYKELITFKTWEERYRYLKLTGCPGEMTFNGARILNQQLYHSKEWRLLRNQVISRDKGYDLGLEEWPIIGRVMVHHIEPITIEDCKKKSFKLLDIDNVILCCEATHNAIHYGVDSYKPYKYEERKVGDTVLW